MIADMLNELERLVEATPETTMIVDSEVIAKDSPEYWIYKLSDWRAVRYDTLPEHMPNPRDPKKPIVFLRQIVHFEKLRPFSDMKPALVELINRARLAASGLSDGRDVPLPDVRKLLAERPQA